MFVSYHLETTNRTLGSLGTVRSWFRLHI